LVPESVEDIWICINIDSYGKRLYEGENINIYRIDFGFPNWCPRLGANSEFKL
jgi:hypothetical protein